MNKLFLTYPIITNPLNPPTMHSSGYRSQNIFTQLILNEIFRISWFDKVKIENKKFDWNANKTDKVLTTSYGSTIWARFYDLTYSKPLFADRDGKAYDDVSKISQERRTGYSWYGTWCANNIKLGTLPEPSSSSTQTQGTHLYVGYSNKSNNYNTIQAAVNAAASKNPSSEQTRVSIHIAPGTYR